MSDRILVPLDGSPRAEAILPWVEYLARIGDSELILTRVENPIVGGDPFFVPNPPLYSETPVEAARQYLLQIGERLHQKGLRSRPLVLSGAPAEALRTVAAEERVSLIAMTTHGRTGLFRLVLGSIAEQVIRQAPAPVFVVRSPGSQETPIQPAGSAPFRNVLIPLEGSELAPGILPFASHLAARAHAQVVLLHVLDPREESKPPAEGAPARMTEEELSEKFLKEAARQVSAAGARAVTFLERGEPAETIRNACRQYDIDLIALTTHGRSGLSRWFAGSVTERLLHEATVPLLISSARHSPAPRKRQSKV